MKMTTHKTKLVLRGQTLKMLVNDDLRRVAAGAAGEANAGTAAPFSVKEAGCVAALRIVG